MRISRCKRYIIKAFDIQTLSVRLSSMLKIFPNERPASDDGLVPTVCSYWSAGEKDGTCDMYSYLEFV